MELRGTFQLRQSSASMTFFWKTCKFLKNCFRLKLNNSSKITQISRQQYLRSIPCHRLLSQAVLSQEVLSHTLSFHRQSLGKCRSNSDDLTLLMQQCLQPALAHFDSIKLNQFGQTKVLLQNRIATHSCVTQPLSH